MSENSPKSSNGRLKPDKILTLGEVERALRIVMSQVPSRPTIIGYIQSGKLRGTRHPYNRYWYVRESSLTEFIEQILKDAV